ncbi:MAG: rhomboid family intramembrane serine protease [Alphaproteobacteria bacterium]|nr:rhomboid family intramembrane serine protease [Alphaproteobacteria bacterium]
MAKKSNGSGRDDDKLISFPTLAERDRMRKQRMREEEEWQNEYKSRRAQPFFNLSRIPPFTASILAVFLFVHVVLHFLFDAETILKAYFNFGFVPGSYTGAAYKIFPFLIASPFTHLFLHGSWMHLFFNATMTLSLGLFFEKEFGTRRALVFFVVCGLGGALFYFALNPFSVTPMIGASGSISGYFGAMILLISRHRPLSKHGPWPLVIFWVLFMVILGSVGGQAIAWQSHVGGFLTGIILLRALQRRK